MKSCAHSGKEKGQKENEGHNTSIPRRRLIGLDKKEECKSTKIKTYGSTLFFRLEATLFAGKKKKEEDECENVDESTRTYLTFCHGILTAAAGDPSSNCCLCSLIRPGM